MSEPALNASSEPCPLCEVSVADDVKRCPSCGLHLAGVGGRPLFTQPLLWKAAMGFLAVYLITLVIVVTTR
jgi:hypothetical protein